jgi:hypothetical protein
MNTVTTYADVIPYYTSPYVPYGLDPTDLPTQTLGGGYLALQFQYPCQLEVVVEDCEVGPGQVTIFGYDWYLQPIQENVPIDNNGEDPATITVNTSRAFYGVTGVYVGQACPAGSGAMTISTTSNYGLPYTLWSKTCVTSISMYDGDTRYTPTFQKGDPLSVHNEPRGIVSWPTVGGPPDPDGAHYLDITYVLQGATPWNKMMEQIAGGANPARTAWTFPEGISGIPPFSADALIGVKPFYVGGYDNY